MVTRNKVTDSDLTAKEQRFIDEYIVCLNGTEAASRAGYAGDRATLATQSSRMLRKAKVSRAIHERLETLAMPSNEVIVQVTDIARNDMGDVLNSFGGLDIAEAMRRGKTNQIKSYKSKVTTITEKDGTEREIIETEIEMYDRQAALNTLAKFHSLLIDRVRQEDWRTDVIKLLMQGLITPAQLEAELGEQIAREIITAVQLPITIEREV